MSVWDFVATAVIRAGHRGVEVARRDTGAVLLQGALNPGKIIREAWKRNAPIPFQWIEAESLFVGVGAFDRIIVVETIDAGAGPIAGHGDRCVLRRLIGDHAGGDAGDGEKLSPRTTGFAQGQQVDDRVQVRAASRSGVL